MGFCCIIHRLRFGRLIFCREYALNAMTRNRRWAASQPKFGGNVRGTMQVGPLTPDVILGRAETLWPSKQLLWPHIDQCKTVRHVVVMDDTDGSTVPELPDDARLLDYEAVIAVCRAAPVRVRH
jgi:hypothetical protein